MTKSIVPVEEKLGKDGFAREHMRRQIEQTGRRETTLPPSLTGGRLKAAGVEVASFE